MTTQVQIRLSEAELAILDEMSGEGTRSDVLRAGLAALVREYRRAQIDRGYVDEYVRVPETREELKVAGSEPCRVALRGGPVRPEHAFTRRLGDLGQRHYEKCAALDALADC